MPVDPLTPSQERFLAAVANHWRAHGIAPTYRDLAAVLGFRSTNAVSGMVRVLVKKGRLECDATTSRTLWPAGWRDRIRAALAADADPGFAAGWDAAGEVTRAAKGGRHAAA